MSKPINVLIYGDNKFNDYQLFKNKCDLYLKTLGSDSVEYIKVLICSSYQDMVGIYLKDLPEHLKETEIYVSYINESIGNNAITEIIKRSTDCAIIFWDGESSDIKSIINKCEWFEHKYRVVNYR